MAIADDRAKAVELALAQIEKQFGKGSIVRLGSKEALLPIAVISTGSISFDAALGVGGIPRGRVTEVFGPESSGKTTITLQIIAEAQRPAAWPHLSMPSTPSTRATPKSSASTWITCWFLSPIAANRPLKSPRHWSAPARWTCWWSTRLPLLCPRPSSTAKWATPTSASRPASCPRPCASSPARVSKSRTALIFINQIREKIGVMFGNPETTTGGRALKFYSSVRVDIRRIAAIKEGDAVTGNRTKVKIVKNKVAAPFREAEFDILYGEGISREGDVLDLAVANNIVEKSGAWYSYSGERIGQGRENTRTFLKENKDIFAKMDAELRKKLNIGAVKAEVPEVPAAGPTEAKEAVRPRRG